MADDTSLVALPAQCEPPSSSDAIKYTPPSGFEPTTVALRVDENAWSLAIRKYHSALIRNGYSAELPSFVIVFAEWLLDRTDAFQIPALVVTFGREEAADALFVDPGAIRRGVDMLTCIGAIEDADPTASHGRGDKKTFLLVPPGAVGELSLEEAIDRAACIQAAGRGTRVERERAKVVQTVATFKALPDEERTLKNLSRCAPLLARCAPLLTTDAARIYGESKVGPGRIKWRAARTEVARCADKVARCADKVARCAEGPADSVLCIDVVTKYNNNREALLGKDEADVVVVELEKLKTKFPAFVPDTVKAEDREKLTSLTVRAAGIHTWTHKKKFNNPEAILFGCLQHPERISNPAWAQAKAQFNSESKSSPASPVSLTTDVAIRARLDALPADKRETLLQTVIDRNRNYADPKWKERIAERGETPYDLALIRGAMYKLLLAEQTIESHS